MGFNPRTLKWIMSDKLRLTIQSDIQGFPTTWYFYEDDFNLLDEDGVPGVLKDLIEVGWIQFIQDNQIAEHGGRAPYKRNNTSEQSSGSKEPETWQCPVHGSSSVAKAKFGSGLQCTRWEEFNGSMPTWANPTVREYNGVKRVYCSNREIPLKRA